MVRYLVRKRAKSLEIATVPKGMKLQRGAGGFRAVTKAGKRGVLLKGYKIVNAKNRKQVVNKIVKSEISQEMRYNRKVGLI